ARSTRVRCGQAISASRARLAPMLRYLDFDWTEGADGVITLDAMASTTGYAGTLAGLREVLLRMADAGADEVQLIPTGSDVAQVEAVAELAAGLAG
ncbi:hypothetical protein NL466_27015, partial [Klebsiella pneumoniae]|nr:hypothetical protein [Klebsiella pneumoniae]